MAPAKIAVISITRTSARPKRPSGSASRRRSAEGRASDRTVADSKVGADTGIEPGDQQVGGKRAERKERGGDQHGPADHGKIAGDHRIEHQLAGAGSGEDDLREDGAGEQVTDADAEERH